MKPPGRASRCAEALIRLGVGTALAVAGMTAGCSGPADHSKTTEQAQLLAFHRYDLEFRYPAAWLAKEQPALSTSQTMLITYLTPSVLHNPCRKWASPSGGGGTCQGFAITTLPPRGAFVTWWLDGSPTGMPVIGSRQIIGGHPAVVSKHDPGACGELDAQASITAAIRNSRGNWYVMTACLRGPGLAGAEAEVRAMLRSVHFQEP